MAISLACVVEPEVATDRVEVAPLAIPVLSTVPVPAAPLMTNQQPDILVVPVQVHVSVAPAARAGAFGRTYSQTAGPPTVILLLARTQVAGAVGVIAPTGSKNVTTNQSPAAIALAHVAVKLVPFVTQVPEFCPAVGGPLNVAVLVPGMLNALVGAVVPTKAAVLSPGSENRAPDRKAALLFPGADNEAATSDAPTHAALLSPGADSEAGIAAVPTHAALLSPGADSADVAVEAPTKAAVLSPGQAAMPA
jgi:hypothetical protein